MRWANHSSASATIFPTFLQSLTMFCQLQWYNYINTMVTIALLLYTSLVLFILDLEIKFPFSYPVDLFDSVVSGHA